MRKTCGLVEQKVSTKLRTTLLFSTRTIFNKTVLSISASFTQFSTQFVQQFLHIKFSLNQSVNEQLSTVSTPPIIRSITLNFKNLLII